MVWAPCCFILQKKKRKKELKFKMLENIPEVYIYPNDICPFLLLQIVDWLFLIKNISSFFGNNQNCIK